MISRRHRLAAPRQLGAAPGAPPAPAPPVASFPTIWPTSPAGKAALAGVLYAGAVFGVFLLYEKITSLQMGSVQLDLARQRAAGGRRRRSAAPRKRASKPKSKSLISEIFNEDPGDEVIDLGQLKFVDGSWMVKKGETWEPFVHPGYEWD